MHPFEAPYSAIQQDPDVFVSSVFSNLISEFLVMPKGEGFVEYATFEAGYEGLKQVTKGFQVLTAKRVIPLALKNPIVVIVLRAMLGLTPSEWAYLATQRTSTKVTQMDARALDRKIRMHPENPIRAEGLTFTRLQALLAVACDLLTKGAPAVAADKIHRLQKADTSKGRTSIQQAASLGVPYAMLLYERFLGRPFAGHRDSVSELVGNNMESAIEDVLTRAGVSYRKTRRAERIADFDQAPDFIVPSEYNPKIVIEAKIADDDGTARDKVTRVQHLRALSMIGQRRNQPKFEVIACIGGRGFGVRREDMRKLLLATRGKVFTLKTLEFLVQFTSLKEFQTKQA